MRTPRLVHAHLMHPRTGEPLAAVGQRRDGTPIWPILGGDGTGEGGEAAATGTGTPEGEGASAATGSTGAGEGATGATGTGGIDDFPPAAQKLIRELRDEAAKHRTGKTAAEQKAQSQLDNIAKALGFKQDEKLNAEQLAQKLNTSDSQARTALTELAVYRAAAKTGADGDALLDSRAFLTRLTDLDPTADDFAAKVNTAVKDAVKDNPKLKAAQAAGKSGGEFNGGSGDDGQITATQFTSMTAEQIADALNKGKLKHLL